MDTQLLSFSFLTSGPSYTCEIPATLPPVPELSSPVLSGVGAREFAFVPDPTAQELSEGMARDGELLRTMIDRDGRPVELYLRSDPPLVWWLRWKLAGGVLVTHLRAIDGIESADTVVANVSVADEGPTPFLLLYAPLRRLVSSFPGFQEFASVWSRDRGLALTFVRPPFLSPGKVMSTGSGEAFQFRAAWDSGIEVQVSSAAEPEGKDTLYLVLESLREGS